eukprot:1224240-Amphidinium_carterae.3
MGNGSTCRSAPTGSHASIGAIERWHQDLRGQVKAMIAELNSHLGGLEVEIGSPIRVWLVLHSAWLLAQFQTYKETTLAQALEPEPGNKTTNRVSSGYWFGRAEGSDENSVALESGMIQRYRT